ncbi:Endonuclease/exonuclease/phosphatase [Mortierella sp. GBAus27b]|nr:hypothetical protein BGX31_008698 [Mortierella sp. GBA43]KAI8348738.1 Endonuclease/exonuclease/phosphatase [Mortierella sp. GBAus27b]
MVGVIQTALPIYFDFRISVAQTKPVDKDDKQSVQDSKNDFTLKLLSDQTEVSVHTDDLETLQGMLRELRRSHLIAQDDNFYAGGSTHRWVQYYTVEEDVKVPGSEQEPVMTMDEFITSTPNPLTMYFLQPEVGQPRLPSAGPRLELGRVKESWIEKEMRSRESAFTEYSYMHTFVGTWNVNGKSPTSKLDSWLKVEGTQPDIYVLCFQELDLSTEAYIITDAAKEEEWTQAINASLGKGYHKIMSKQLVGLLIIMYVAEVHKNYVKEVTTHSAGVGIMGMLGNKGGVSIRIRYKDSYLCFVNSHLAHDTSQIERRNQDYQEICRRLAFPSSNPYDITKSPAGNAAMGGGTKMVSIFESDHTIWGGDLNYRIALPEDLVKTHVSARNYDALLKHDQLIAQQRLSRAFSEFDEPPITFQPTFKYDVGTNTWDSSEKRRVPAYTDRILYRSKGTSKDNVEALFYKSHMEQIISDHKPVSALFKLKVKTLLHDKQAEVHQAIVRELDRYENECMPDAIISTFNVIFEDVRYLEPRKQYIVIKNTGQFPAQYRFKPKLQDEGFCRPWLWVNPPVAMVMPGESAKIHLTVMVNNESAPLLNTGKETLEDILILHLEHGKDYFISVAGSYIRTCFGNSLEWLSRLDRPIRLWDPKEEEEDEEDEENVYDLYNVPGNKSSMSSIKDSAARDASSTGSKQVKSVKSSDTLSETESIATGLSQTRISDEKRRPLKRSQTVRQLSLPKDLWRIVDFIYKYGFSVDNLFLLSGDQSTMSYIRECLDTGEEFDLSRLLDKPSQQDASTSSAKASSDDVAAKQKDTEASNSAPPLPPRGPVPHITTTALASRGSASDLKPQIARPVSILNGIPPKAANFGSGENRGIHSMAEVLLRFLESLSEPVVPTEMYYKALEIAGHQQAAYGLLDLMPPVHVNVFVYITSFLREMILVGGSHSSPSTPSGRDNGSNINSSGPGATNNSRILQGSSGSIYNGVDPSSGPSGGRVKRDDEDYRVSRLASVFASVMLRPPPGAERVSEAEALRRKMFMMQFLQEPVEEESLLGSAPPTPSSAVPTTSIPSGSIAALSSQVAASLSTSITDTVTSP